MAFGENVRLHCYSSKIFIDGSDNNIPKVMEGLKAEAQVRQNIGMRYMRIAFCEKTASIPTSTYDWHIANMDKQITSSGPKLSLKNPSPFKGFFHPKFLFDPHVSYFLANSHFSRKFSCKQLSNNQIGESALGNYSPRPRQWEVFDGTWR